MTNMNSIIVLPTGHQHHVPSIGQRWLARFIDNVPMLIVLYVGIWLSSVPALVALLILAPIYEIALIKRYGQTVGKMIMNVRVVRFSDGADLDWKQSFVRWFVWQTPLWIYLLIGAIVFGTGGSLLESLVIWLVIGVFMHVVELAFTAVIAVTTLRDPNLRGWHDKCAQSVVIRVPGTEPAGMVQPSQATAILDRPPVSEKAGAPGWATSPGPSAAPPAPAGAVRRQISIAVPSADRVLVVVGALLMVLSGLMSWLEWAPDAFPNFAGVGADGGGVGLAVFLIGLGLLFRASLLDTQVGAALGAFAAALITITTVDGGDLGMGAWVAMVGSLLAVVGSALAATDANRRPARRLERAAPAWLGAVLFVLASFWMDWPRNAAHSSNDDPFTVGIDGDVGTGYAVLVLGVMVFVLLGQLSSAAPRGGAATCVHVAGIAVAVMAAASIIGSVMYAEFVGSGPVLALIGSLMVTRSVVPATEPAGETAEPEVAKR